MTLHIRPWSDHQSSMLPHLGTHTKVVSECDQEILQSENGQQPKSLGGIKNILLIPNLRPSTAVIEAQTMLSSHGGFLTIAMHHYRETIYKVEDVNCLNTVQRHETGYACNNYTMRTPELA